MSRLTKVMSHIIGIRKKADSQKRFAKQKSLDNPGLEDRNIIYCISHIPFNLKGLFTQRYSLYIYMVILRLDLEFS